MFDRVGDYPTAVASYDEEGIAAAIAWCQQHLGAGQKLTVWTALKSNLGNCPALEQLVKRHSNVDHVTGRGGGTVHGRGPVLMAWPDMDDIAKLTRYGSHLMTGLCVLTWNEKWIRPWVSAVGPQILGDGSPWQQVTPALDPLVALALEDLTAVINHNNTISSGFEKDEVVSVLFALRRAGVGMDGPAMQGWALANGWSGSNPQRLAQYVADVNAGKRLRHGQVLRADYVDHLRRRLAAGTQDDNGE